MRSIGKIRQPLVFMFIPFNKPDKMKCEFLQLSHTFVEEYNYNLVDFTLYHIIITKLIHK